MGSWKTDTYSFGPWNQLHEGIALASAENCAAAAKNIRRQPTAMNWIAQGKSSFDRTDDTGILAEHRLAIKVESIKLPPG